MDGTSVRSEKAAGSDGVEPPSANSPRQGGASPRKTWLIYVTAVSFAGVGLLPFILLSPGLRTATNSGGFWLLSVLVLLGELFPLRVQMADGLTENTTSVTFSLALLFAFGLGPAVLPNIVSSALADIAQRKSPLKVLFNAGQYTLSFAAAGVVYHFLHGPSMISVTTIPAIVAAGGTLFLVNTVLTSIAVGLWQGSRLVPYVYRNIVFSAHMTPALIALSPIVVLVADVSLWFVPLFAIPIGAVYWGMNKALENARLVDQLRDSLDQMNEVNRLKDEFVAVVSHELRTPLTSIQGYIKTILQLHGQLEEEQERAFLEASVRQSDRLRGLIEQLLVVGRLDAHAESLVVAPVSIPTVASNVVGELQPRVRGHTFDLRFAEDVPVVETDEEKVHQILSNLVENASKYAPPDTRITIRVEPGLFGVIASVQDEGPGIPENEREQVFERFYQVDSSATRAVGGTGLGLYICRKMAEQIGARIWLDASSPQGCIFSLFVPMTPPKDRETVEEDPGDPRWAAEEPSAVSGWSRVSDRFRGPITSTS